MPLTHGDWQSILKAIEKAIPKSDIQHAVVTRVDKEKQKVWLEGLGPDPIPFASWDFRRKTVDPHDDNRVEYEDVERIMPSVGDAMLVARSSGARSLARIIAPVQYDPEVPGKGQPKKTFVDTQGEFWPGMMIDYDGLLDHTKAGVIDPFGDGKWLYCNGAAVKRSVYPHLFKRIGTRYGAGDGSTTFNLPDFRDGKIPVPRGTNFGTIGATGGARTVTLVINQIPSHSHGGGSHSHSIPNHQHTITNDGLHSHGLPSGLNLTGISGGEIGSPWKGTTGGAAPQFQAESQTNQQGTHNHGGGTGFWSGTTGDASAGGSSAGGDQAHENMPPHVVIGGKIIRVRR